MTAARDALARAAALHRAGRLADAEVAYREAMATSPETAAVVPLATLFLQTGRADDAIALFREHVARNPIDVAAHVALATLLESRGALAEAADAFDRAAALAPADVGARLGLARTALSRGRPRDAIDALGAAVAIAPDAALPRHELGRVLLEVGRSGEAVEHLAAAATLDPDRPEPRYNLGLAWAALGRLDEAADAYRRAIALAPGFAAAYNNLGGVEKMRMRLDEAEAAWRAALALRPDDAAIVDNLAGLAEWQARHDDALAMRRRAMALAPDDAGLHGKLLFTMLFAPGVDAASLRAAHDAWDARHARRLAVRAPSHANDRDPARRLRVGYVSGHFRDHVLGRALLPLLRAHDRDAVELVCYANQRDDDATTDAFRATGAAWRDIAMLSDDDAAALVRADAIDVLVDTTLHMDRNRLLLFARRPAPVQATFAGYPGSTGLGAMDWRLSDPFLDPPEHDDRYVERTWRLPSTFWCYDPCGLDVPVGPPPSAANGFVTFGCLNNFAKTNDGVLALWARVLARVSDARLLILAPRGAHRDRTLTTFASLGIAPSRVEFVDHAPRTEFLALHDRIDVALDTFPYNGHTTSLDALWMGVPVVTLVGETAVGRAGLSQLTNVGLAELVAGTPGEFVDVACALADDAGKLARLRRALRSRMERSPLMDAQAYARGVETGWRAMFALWCEAAAR